MCTAPGINAQYHQHIFSLRVDPMIDGLDNTVIESDIVTVDAPAGSKENYAGNAFTSVDRRITKQSEGVRDFDATVDRRWRIANPARKHSASGKEVAYGISAKGSWELLKGAEGCFSRRRAAFAEHSVWVVKDVEGPAGSERLWPAGKYVPQTCVIASLALSSREWLSAALFQFHEVGVIRRILCCRGAEAPMKT